MVSTPILQTGSNTLHIFLMAQTIESGAIFESDINYKVWTEKVKWLRANKLSLYKIGIGKDSDLKHDSHFSIYLH